MTPPSFRRKLESRLRQRANPTYGPWRHRPATFRCNGLLLHTENREMTGAQMPSALRSLMRWRRRGTIAVALIIVAIAAAASGCTSSAQTPPDDNGLTTLAPTSQVQITTLPTPVTREQAPGDSAASPTVSPITPTPPTGQRPTAVAPEPTATDSSGAGSGEPTETPALPAATPANVPAEPSPTSIPLAPTATTAPPTPTPIPPPTGHRVGDSAPDFTVETVDGVTRSLTDYKQANQPVVVYFFATW